MGTGITSAVTDCSAFLADAIKAIEELNRSKKACEDLEAEEERIDKELEQERLDMADTINQTVKKRRDGISASYDKEIGTEQDRLRKIRAKREKAKNQGIKERIAEETKELKEKNQELSMQLKTLFKQNRVPSVYDKDMVLRLLYAWKPERTGASDPWLSGMLCGDSIGFLSVYTGGKPEVLGYGNHLFDCDSDFWRIVYFSGK